RSRGDLSASGLAERQHGRAAAALDREARVACDDGLQHALVGTPAPWAPTAVEAGQMRDQLAHALLADEAEVVGFGVLGDELCRLAVIEPRRLLRGRSRRRARPIVRG